MMATRVLRQAAAAAERQPLIRFVGRRNIPENIDHTPQPHPASPTGQIPVGAPKTGGNSFNSFSSYRDSAQQHGPLRKSVGAQTGANLGPVEAPKGMYFDRNDLPARFRRTPLNMAEIEAIETGGASLYR